MKELTQERVREVLSYDPQTGVFIRKLPGKGVRVGEVAGSTHKGTGYIRIAVDGQVYGAHRLAWLWMTGNWPTSDIDHANGIRDDNAFGNLRDAIGGINQQNIRQARKNSVTGLLGVSISKSGRYVAQIGLRGRVRRIGVFQSAEVAHEAYKAAKREMHAGCTI